MGHVVRRAVAVVALVALAAITAPSAFAARSSSAFHPRIGNALGLAPPIQDQRDHNFQPDEAGIYTPVTYHGGQTMTGGVTIHTVFWGPAGFPFGGAPPGSKSYIALIEQYFSDVAHASTGTSGAACTHRLCDTFTVEPQYGWGTTPGHITPGDYSVSYSPGTDAVIDRHRYPSARCTSATNAKGCVTDAEVELELSRLIEATRGRPRGLHNLWFMFLPANVDECILPDQCGTNSFLAYHSFFNIGYGMTVYAVGVDPLIEVGGVAPGEDPEGNPDAELSIDAASHETNEAMTDPEGNGWMDPNGWEMADKCEFGPQRGTPLGYAADGSPYNQLINGHEYLTQTLWSNDDHGCVQATTRTTDPLPLPQVNLTQFSGRITGNTEGERSGIRVTVKLIREGTRRKPVTVAMGSGKTDRGRWAARLSGGHAVGDDRDVIDVDYGGAGAPHDEVIRTGNGGNAFTESGWVGWTALDGGVALRRTDPSVGGGPSLDVGPCFQTGVITYTGIRGFGEPASQFCGTASDAADTPLLGAPGPGTRITVSSSDNRAFSGANLGRGSNPTGALVRLTVPVGEANAQRNFPAELAPFMTPTGFPICAADLGRQRVRCTGLVAHRSYTLSDRSDRVRGRANSRGVLKASMTVMAGNVLRLSNRARTLTTLHVAHLRVHLVGRQSSVAGGTCSPGEYWGGPLTAPPTGRLAGEPTKLDGVFLGGSALTGRICPLSGRAAGLPDGRMVQTDELSGGETFTDVANIANTSPVQDETLYGPFTMLARVGSGRPQISVSISPRGHHKVVFRASNVDTARGIPVRGLRAGEYRATWVVRDRNGDTRTVTTRFIEER